VLARLSIAAEGDEVLFNADFPQQMVLDMIQEHMKPKKTVETTEVKSITKPTVQGRRRGRRR
jgi:hypothetical protein